MVAFAVPGVVKSLLFGVNAFDAVTFASMSGVMLVIAMLPTYVPEYRALSVDPIQALRGE